MYKSNNDFNMKLSNVDAGRELNFMTLCTQPCISKFIWLPDKHTFKMRYINLCCLMHYTKYIVSFWYDFKLSIFSFVTGLELCLLAYVAKWPL